MLCRQTPPRRQSPDPSLCSPHLTGVSPSPPVTHLQKSCPNLRAPPLRFPLPAPDRSQALHFPLRGLRLHLTMPPTFSRDTLETGPRVLPPVLPHDPAMATRQVQAEKEGVFQQTTPNPNAGSPSRVFSVGGKTRTSRGRGRRETRRKGSWLDSTAPSFTFYHRHRLNSITGSARPNPRIPPRNPPSFSPTSQTAVAPPLVKRESYELRKAEKINSWQLMRARSLEL